ncbi:cytochrome c oxidase subunit II [Streptomyces sp. SLBN-31]|uniref:cytochrome c oxidase subunit II n=1 Tax=Streptomyces sp. SLBN-31 TaxID=2768444 RepID=UPI001152DA0B|nr:cytochrome c oxidase subunit II [Streptomyces sp. SLBN-31]TQJ91248.1 cytochrome c oxidase subunit 2 [Streptomyces sp. SLBN-31]
MNQRHVFGEVFTLETAIASFVFVTILVLLIVALVRRRARPGTQPSQRTERTHLESYYLAALAVVATFLVVYTAYANHRQQQTDQHRPTTNVDVTGFQWCWQFGYPGTAGQKVSVSGNCRNGQFPTLVVPTGHNIKVRLTSRDVIHSMWIPALRYKMDAFPNRKNTFTMTFDHEGRWRGRCAEFCGLRHRTMDFWVKAVSPDEYQRWLTSHAAGSGAAA